ncbi:MAG: cytochrome c peroxidase [Bacteroidota bacterium]
MAAICVLIMDACKSSRSISSTNETSSSFVIPFGWPKPALNIFKDNPLTEEGFQLGRRLFYDGILSRDGSLSCGTCHQQFAAFSSFDHNFSHGINNTFTTRNAPGLFNLAWMKEMHWDGGVNHIEVQPLSPITAHNEMGSILDTVLYNLQKDNSYKTYFKKAFGDTVINSQRMLKALAQFTGSIQSYNSKYDKVKNGNAMFTISEKKGYEFFKTNCSACHKEPLFTDNSFHNNGLSINDKLNDWGQMIISKKVADSLKFKTPSLRNVAVTLPYMHDGRFINLSKVIEHYRNLDTANSKNLDPILKAKKINISQTERVDLMAFLYTLTDSVLIHNPRFSSPVNSSPIFKHQH